MTTRNLLPTLTSDGVTENGVLTPWPAFYQAAHRRQAEWIRQYEADRGVEAPDEAYERLFSLEEGMKGASAQHFWHPALPEVLECYGLACPDGEPTSQTVIRGGRCVWYDSSVGPFPPEPAFGSPAAAEQGWGWSDGQTLCRTRSDRYVSPWRVVSVLLLLLCLALPAGAQTMFGTVTRVVDGDTLIVGKAKIRLHGIDAPEGSQTCTAPAGKLYRCGDTAEGFLASLAPPGAHISCRVMDTDKWGRLVARCAVGQKNLSAWMVRFGWAVAFRKYSLQYVPEEDEARLAKRGMWAGRFVHPAEWREGVR